MVHSQKKNKIIQWTLIASWQRCSPEARTLLHKLLELVLSCSKSMESWPWIFLIDWVKSKTMNFVDNLVQFKSTSRPWIMLINWLSVYWKFSTSKDFQLKPFKIRLVQVWVQITCKVELDSLPVQAKLQRSSVTLADSKLSCQYLYQWIQAACLLVTFWTVWA